MKKNKHIQGIRRATSKAKHAVEDAKDSAMDAVENITDSTKNVTESVKDKMTDVKDGVVNTTEDASESVKKNLHKKHKNNDIVWWFILAAVVIGALLMHQQMSKKNTHSISEVFGGGLFGINEVDPNDAQQFSYAVGYMFGQQMKAAVAQAPDTEALDMRSLTRAIGDVMMENDSVLTKTQIDDILAQRAQIEQDKQVVTAQENTIKSAAFIENYAQKENVQKTEGGTYYSIMTEGEGQVLGSRPGMVRYRGMLSDGAEFDSSYSRGEEPVRFAPDETVAGFGEALKLMRIGSTWEIVIPSDKAYGEQGIPGMIGPNEALVFEVELVSLEK